MQRKQVSTVVGLLSLAVVVTGFGIALKNAAQANQATMATRTSTATKPPSSKPKPTPSPTKSTGPSEICIKLKKQIDDLKSQISFVEYNVNDYTTYLTRPNLTQTERNTYTELLEEETFKLEQLRKELLPLQKQYDTDCRSNLY